MPLMGKLVEMIIKEKITKPTEKLPGFYKDKSYFTNFLREYQQLCGLR